MMMSYYTLRVCDTQEKSILITFKGCFGWMQVCWMKDRLILLYFSNCLTPADGFWYGPFEAWPFCTFWKNHMQIPHGVDLEIQI